MTRLEKAQEFYNKHKNINNFETLDYIFNEIFEGDPTKEENRFLRKAEKETGLKEQYEKEKAFLATDYF